MTQQRNDEFEKAAKGEMLLPPNGLPTFSAEGAALAVQGAIESLKHLHRMLSGGTMRPGAISLSFKEALVDLGQAAWHLNLPDVSVILEKAKLKTRVKSPDRVATTNRQAASRVGLLYRVASRFLAKEEALPLAKGDTLVVWMKKGDWWSEMRRGVKLEVKDVQGDKIKIHHAGWANGDGWEMKLAPGQDLSGKFKLDGDPRFRRALVVTRA